MLINNFFYVAVPDLIWTNAGTFPDGVTLSACVGEDVTLDWAYNITARNHHLVDVKWFYTPNNGLDFFFLLAFPLIF